MIKNHIKTNIIKMLIVLVATLVLWVVPLSLVAGAQSSQEAVCDSLGAVSSGSGCDTGSDPDVNSAIKTALDILSLAVGIIAVIMIIIGGLKYITSQGESAATSSAKNTILYAAIGIVIVILAQTIVFFVFDRVTAPPTTPAPATPSRPAPTREPI